MKRGLLAGWVLALTGVSFGGTRTESVWPGENVALSSAGGASVAAAADGGIDLTVKQSELGKWPALYFDFPKPRDLSKVEMLRVSVTNRCCKTLRVGLKVKGDTQQGRLPERAFALPPLKARTFDLKFFAEKWVFDKPHGLVGLKRPPYVGGGSSYSLEKVRSLSVYLSPGVRDVDLHVTHVELVEGETSVREAVTVLKADELHPWVDEFGQAKFAEWPDKVHSVDELRAKGADEERQFREIPSGIPSADRFGGWATGPQLKATGHFRTEKVNGKWWFVDPEGRLFFAHGTNYGWEQVPTGVTGREKYFENLPPETGATAQFWRTHTKPAPSGHNWYSKPENVPFKTFATASYNLYRKHGEGWEEKNVDNTGRRMRSWGLNAICSSVVGSKVRRPYIVGIGPSARPIESAKGYWRPLLDPFDPEFPANCRRAVRAQLRLGTNEYCLGWTSHNELSWGADGASLARSVLAAPDDQPAKRALLKMLEDKGVAADRATDEDLRLLGEAVADKYYSTVRAAIKDLAPDALYLGDRNDKSNPETFRAASRHLDVITVNAYEYRPTRELPQGAVDKPFLVTEFHFGCYDTGYFYASLLPVKDQQTRAECYRTYLRSALDNPQYVGAFWFTWRDCPITGDWNEAANAQCGLVSMADVPYTEMVRALRDIAAEMYTRHSK